MKLTLDGKIISIVVAGVLSLLGFCGLIGVFDNSNIPALLNVVDILPLDNVVQIKVEGEYGESWQATGIFIKDDLVLTAGHVVDSASKICLIWSDGTECDANDWYFETEADLGLIYVKTPEEEKELCFDDAKLGETVWAYGNPFGVFPVLTKGVISAVNASDDYTHQKDMIITDVAVNPGNSGCPLMDEDGHILGICSWGYNNSQGMSYFVRAEICELVLLKYEVIKRLEEIE